MPCQSMRRPRFWFDLSFSKCVHANRISLNLVAAIKSSSILAVYLTYIQIVFICFVFVLCCCIICRHLSLKQDPEFSQSVQRFFTELFPLAYHQLAAADSADFHGDYKHCLMRTFDDLQPFGMVPKQLAKQLYQSTDTATIFLTGLQRAADILTSIEELDTNALTPNCQKQLMKMNYCAQCSGFSRHHTKPCNGYCLNVMR